MAKKEPTPEPKKDPAEELVRMVKGDEALDVHPTTVAAHKERGWVIAQ